MTDVLLTITEAGFDPKSILYSDLRKLFLITIQWLHEKSHVLNEVKRSKENQEQFDTAVQLLGNDYFRGIIEGRFSRCSHGHLECHTVFKVIGEDTIEMLTTFVESSR